jgi:hypothetical protein
VVERDVERLEIELVSLDLRRVVSDKAELTENARDLAAGLDQRVERAARQRASGQRDINLLAGEPDFASYRIESRTACCDCSLKLLAYRVCGSTYLRSVFAGKLAYVRQKLPQLAVPAQVGGFYRIKLVGVIRLFDSRQRLLPESRQAV